jgi:leucyl-tRNA synthetase
VKRVSEGFEDDLKFNTSIAALMELVNDLTALEDPATDADRAAVREALGALAALLAPFAPHVAEELWHELQGPKARDRFVVEEPWPAWDPALVAADVVTIAVQVNGKLRGEVQAPAAAAEADVRALAESDERVKAHLAGKTIRKVVFVPKRLMNFVVG